MVVCSHPLDASIQTVWVWKGLLAFQNAAEIMQVFQYSTELHSNPASSVNILHSSAVTIPPWLRNHKASEIFQCRGLNMSLKSMKSRNRKVSNSICIHTFSTCKGPHVVVAPQDCGTLRCPVEPSTSAFSQILQHGFLQKGKARASTNRSRYQQQSCAPCE